MQGLGLGIGTCHRSKTCTYTLGVQTQHLDEATTGNKPQSGNYGPRDARRHEEGVDHRLDRSWHRFPRGEAKEGREEKTDVSLHWRVETPWRRGVASCALPELSARTWWVQSWLERLSNCPDGKAATHAEAAYM